MCKKIVCFASILLIFGTAEGHDNVTSNDEVNQENMACLTKISQASGQNTLAPDSAEYLYNKLFGHYPINARPVKNISTPVTVYVKISLKSLEKIDMKAQRQMTRLELELQWKDDNLVWDPVKYRNITQFNVQSNKIWLPDLTVESETGSFDFIKTTDIGKVVVDFEGTVILWPSVYASLGTKLEISKYPFDTQNVTIIFGSWSYNSKQVAFKLNKEHAPLRRYQTNGEWEMQSFSVIEWVYEFDGSDFQRIGYRFTVHRRWRYYALNIIGPVVIACLLNLLVFLLPAASGQRVTLAISICLSLTVFLTQIKDSMPKTSIGVSILVIYLFLQIIGSVLTIGVSVLVIYLNERAATKEQPSSSKVLSFLCRSVVPSQVLKSFNNESTTASPEHSSHEPKQEAGTARPRSHGLSMIGRSKSETDRRSILVIASEYINRASLWLSVIWNIVLLITFIVVVVA